MSSKESVYRVQILEQHLDTFGHVNNATYLQLLEEARWEIITRNGFGLEQIQKSQTGPVILEIHISFVRELRLRETITIQTECQEFKDKIGSLTQIILNEKGETACKARLVFGMFDLKLRKLKKPTPKFLKAIGWTGSLASGSK